MAGRKEKSWARSLQPGPAPAPRTCLGEGPRTALGRVWRGWGENLRLEEGNRDRKKPPPTSAGRNVGGVGRAQDLGVQKLNARQQREPALALREPALEPALGSYLPRFALRSQSLSGGVCIHVQLPGRRASTKAKAGGSGPSISLA